ncbi:MAG: TonB-dependent receptor [Pirellulales bacterium]|nr:TonB-dependent receptor [Pirellulales bacterium]
MKARRTAKVLLVLLTPCLLVACLSTVGWAQSAEDLYQPGPDPIAPELSPQQQGEKESGDLDMLDMDLKQLSQVATKSPSLDMEVSTVARTQSTVGRSPAAVFVITNEMIRRSGVRTLPDALRLAPGVDVAQIDASQWAVTIRGFNNRFANKLLVQIDGRSVYSPWFGGVFWDTQNVVLEDVERIEVIRGPGGTIWGANAVNGVINIITKSSKETQGGFYEGGGGTEQRGFNTLRYGGQLGNDLNYRVYGMWFERDESCMPYRDAQDGARMAQTGFRTDWKASRCDTMTLQGDYYDGYNRGESLVPGSYPTPPTPFVDPFIEYDHSKGANVLYRWTRKLGDESDWSFQMYYDHARRKEILSPLRARSDILDLDFQYRFPLGSRHDVICGCAYRNTDMEILGIPFQYEFIPPYRNDSLYSYFVQDQITLREDLLFLIAGSKFEHNNYTGFEYQPSIRLLWTPDDQHSLWASVSRAVRVPSFIDANIQYISVPPEIVPFFPPYDIAPIFPVFVGNANYGSEDVLAYEAGIRVQPTDAFYWDLAVFYNRYEKLQTLQLTGLDWGATPGGWPAGFAYLDSTNLAVGETYGFELAASYLINEQWTLRGSYSFLRMLAYPLVPDAELVAAPGSNPRNQFNLWLSGDLSPQWHVDFIGRYVDVLPALGAPRYFVGDVRLAWRPQEHFEMFVVGRNLFDRTHSEFGTGDAVGTFAQEVPREVYGGLTWKF